MARTTQEIYNEIIAEKESFSSLNGLVTPVASNQATLLLSQLNSTSRVAIWRLWAWVIAFAIFTLEKLWDTTKAELTSLADEAFIGSDKWLCQKVKDAQLGDFSLITADYRVTYANIDPSKRFITKVAIGRENGVCVVKVAAGETSDLRTLTTAELAYGQAWLTDIQFVSPKAVMVSRSADLLKTTLKIYYSGLYAESDVKDGVESAIAAFLANNDDPNGYISVQLLTDKIQAVAGVKDVEIDTIEAKSASATGYTNFTNQRGYAPFAGYAKYKSGSSTITMIPA